MCCTYVPITGRKPAQTHKSYITVKLVPKVFSLSRKSQLSRTRDCMLIEPLAIYYICEFELYMGSIF